MMMTMMMMTIINIAFISLMLLINIHITMENLHLIDAVCSLKSSLLDLHDLVPAHVQSRQVRKPDQKIVSIISKMGLIYDHHLLKRPRALILVIWLSARIRWVVVVGIPDGIS